MTGEGRLRWTHGETWYRIVGDLDPAGLRTPIVVLHGGPGATHDYCEPIADLARDGRACILYDQIGNGRSDHLAGAPASFWTPEVFKDELAALVAHLGIAARYAVVGQSWGGMLAMDHALDHPPGLRGMAVCDSPASMRLWVEEADRLRRDLPAEVEATLRRHEDAGTTTSAEYLAAVEVFYERHVCRVARPDCVQRSFAAIEAAPTVYHTMNGPSEFHVVGSLRDWDITDRLDRIDVPTLLVSGRYDEATPRIVGEIYARIPGAQWQVFARSSHLPHIEEHAAFIDRVAAFLGTLD